MSLQLFTEHEGRLLEKIVLPGDGSPVAINETLFHQIEDHFKTINLDEFDHLSFRRERSFYPQVPINDASDRKVSYQQFIQFLGKIDVLSDTHKCYLLALATLSWNGIIREKALVLLSFLNPRFALPFVLMGLRNWVPQLRLTAQRCCKEILPKWKISSVMEFGRLTKAIFDTPSLKHYFYHEYLRRQSPKTLLKCMHYLNDNEIAYELWDHIAERGLGNTDLFLLAQKSQYPRVRYHAFRYMPLMMVNIYEKDLKKLPDYYAHLFIRSLAFQMEFVKTSPLLQGVLTDYLFRNHGRIRMEAAQMIHDLGLPLAINFGDLYRDALAKGQVKPGVIRGLGERGQQDDIDCLLPFIESPRAKIRGATIYALYLLGYSEWGMLATQLLEDSHFRVRREAKELLNLGFTGLHKSPWQK